jgi:hypothetical protein
MYFGRKVPSLNIAWITFGFSVSLSKPLNPTCFDPGVQMGPHHCPHLNDLKYKVKNFEYK